MKILCAMIILYFISPQTLSLSLFIIFTDLSLIPTFPYFFLIYINNNNLKLPYNICIRLIKKKYIYIYIYNQYVRI